MNTLVDLVEMSQHLPLIYLAVGLVLTLWIFRHQREWSDFLASLDTNGGHVIILVLLLVVGYRMFQSDATAGGQLMTGAEAALFILLNSKRPTRTGDAPPDATSATTTTVTATTSQIAPPVAPDPPPV